LLQEKLIRRARGMGRGSVIEPWDIAKNIKKIASHFSIHRQEDAHEFLRTLVDTMQRCCGSPQEFRDLDNVLKPYPFSLFAGSLVVSDYYYDNYLYRFTLHI